jgi:hypothetical protein
MHDCALSPANQGRHTPEQGYPLAASLTKRVESLPVPLPIPGLARLTGHRASLAALRLYSSPYLSAHDPHVKLRWLSS